MIKNNIHSTLSQLVGAYRRHLSSRNQINFQDSSNLLLFYAVECGLKARYLRLKRLNSTHDFRLIFGENKPYGHNHDLCKWFKEIKLSAQAIPEFIDNPSDPISNLHEKLRYGVNPNPTILSKQVNFLNGLANILKNKI